MSFFRQPVTTPTYTGLQLQTSNGAIPIPIVYGITKIAPNIIWNGNFRAYYSGGKGGGGGGKGGGSSKGAAPSNYSAAVILGLCEGPINAVRSVWSNSTITGLAYTLTMLGPTFFSGTTPQSVWNYLSTDFPSQALAYGGTAYVADYAVNLGSSATLSSYAFELLGVLSETGFNGNDADPALIVQDFLTNAQYGVGFPAASIDATTLLGSSGDSSYQSYCKAAGLALSPAIISQEAAHSILTRWLQLTNTAAVWSSGVLKFVPYGDAAVTGPVYAAGSGNIGFGTYITSLSYAYVVTPANQIGTCTFAPNLTPIYDLADDDYVYDNDRDPVQIERSDPYAAYNMQYLEISQRTNYYDATPVSVWDQNAIELYGLRIAATVTAHEICDPAVAQTAAQLILQRGLYIRNHYTFKLSWEYCLLEPMDLVTLSDANLGLSKTVVRITEIEEDDNGLLTFTAEEFPAGIATSVAYPMQAPSAGGISTSFSPAAVNPPIIFEPPPALSGGVPQIWAAVSGGSGGTADPNWGGANVWASLDNSTYTQIGRVAGPATQGVLTAALATLVPPNPDMIDTLSVSLAESNGVLASTSASGAQNGATLCRVDDEFLSFQTAVLTATNAYNVTTLYRGLYGSLPASHASGASFARLDDAIFKYDLAANYIGQTIYLKFQSFNVFGSGLQDLSTCVAYTYIPSGAGASDPITAQLATGIALDLGLVTQMPPAANGDLGTLSAPVLDALDLGTIS
ncbi:MAG: phage tail protein [Methylovirgula sp.]